MITKIERADVPCPGCRERNEMREFARRTLDEFLNTTKVGEIVEVTGFPVACEDEVKNAERFMGAISTEAFHLSCQSEAKRFRRKGRVFIERKEGHMKGVTRKPNPYPYD